MPAQYTDRYVSLVQRQNALLREHVRIQREIIRILSEECESYKRQVNQIETRNNMLLNILDSNCQ